MDKSGLWIPANIKILQLKSLPLNRSVSVFPQMHLGFYYFMKIQNYFGLLNYPTSYFLGMTQETHLLENMDMQKQLCERFSACCQYEEHFVLWQWTWILMYQKHFPRLKLALYLDVQADNLDVIFWGRNNWFALRRACLPFALAKNAYYVTRWFAPNNVSNTKNMSWKTSLPLSQAEKIFKFRSLWEMVFLSTRCCFILLSFFWMDASFELLLWSGQSSSWYFFPFIEQFKNKTFLK